MQAIYTKYLPATNRRSSRIKASCERGSTIVSYDSEHTEETMHRVACAFLCLKFAKEDQKKYGTELNDNPWTRPFVTGGLPQGGYAHVFIKGGNT